MTTWQIPTTVPLDAELWATTVIRAALAARSEAFLSGVVVDHKIPNPRPSRLVAIRRDGGSFDGTFDHPRLTINVFAPTEQDANAISGLLVTLMLRLRGGDGTCTAMKHVGGPSEVPDAAPRRLLNFEATLRGEALT